MSILSMHILGLASESHDSGLALLSDGIPTLILEEERFNREKHTQRFPAQSLAAAFGAERADFADVEVITTPWDVALLRRSFLGAVMGRFPSSLALTFPGALTTQDRGIIFLNVWLQRDLKRQFPGRRIPPIVNVGHHNSHAAIYFVSPFEDATVIVMDGYGDDAASSVFTGEGHRLTRQSHGRFFDSLGMIYTLVTMHLGFAPFEEGSVMALAACGTDSFVGRIRDLVRLEDEGRFSINMDYFNYDRFGMRRPFTPKFIETFGAPRRRGEPLTQHYLDVAYALQKVSEEVVLHVIRAAAKRYPSRNLVMTGGVALNCVANGRLLAETEFERLWVPPCASDTGAPLGSALWHYHQTLGHERRTILDHGYHGLSFDETAIRAALDASGMRYDRLAEPELLDRVARDLVDNKTIGWFQGRFEIGPRALGNRSILASPMTSEIRDILNARVKFREPFRPFAPSVLEEHASSYFEMSGPDPFMTIAPKVRAEMRERIPAAVHVDGTARVQTVSATTNPRYHALISAFMKRTGVPILLNTSFNKQEPIVATPTEAISCFLRTDLDVLVMGDFYCADRPSAAVANARLGFDIIEINTRGGE
jgi:carbamoyltransferase